MRWGIAQPGAAPRGGVADGPVPWGLWGEEMVRDLSAVDVSGAAQGWLTSGLESRPKPLVYISMGVTQMHLALIL